MDIQLTDFENTCLIVMMGLLTNVINHFDVDFILPVTMCDENMKRAHLRDAILNQKFWFKKNFIRNKNNYTTNDLEKNDYKISNKGHEKLEEQQYEEMTIAEILTGKDGFMGLMPLIMEFCQ